MADFAQPHPIHASPPTWVRFEPRSLHVSSIASGVLGLGATVGAEGVLALVVGEAPEAQPVAPLPRNDGGGGTEGIHLAVPIEVAWDRLGRLVHEQVAGARIDTALPGGVGGSATLLRVLDIYPSGSSLAVGLKVRLELGGLPLETELWLVGRPVLQGESLRIQDFDYGATTDVAAIDRVHALLHDAVRTRLSERLTVDLAGPKAAMLDDLNAVLRKGPEGAPVEIRGAVHDAQLTGVALSEDALVVYTTVSGRLAITAL